MAIPSLTLEETTILLTLRTMQLSRRRNMEFGVQSKMEMENLRFLKLEIAIIVTSMFS